MRPVLPMIIASALSDSIYSIFFIPFMSSYMRGKDYTLQEEDRLGLFAMISFGVGEIIGCLIFGQI